MREKKIGVLFLHAQAAFGADSAIHVQLMRHLDRNRFEVHAAYTRGEGAGMPASRIEIERIPDVRLVPMSFLPGIRERNAAAILRSLVPAARAPVDFASLALYIRRAGIRIVHSTDRPRDSQ